MSSKQVFRSFADLAEALAPTGVEGDQSTGRTAAQLYTEAKARQAAGQKIEAVALHWNRPSTMGESHKPSGACFKNG